MFLSLLIRKQYAEFKSVCFSFIRPSHSLNYGHLRFLVTTEERVKHGTVLGGEWVRGGRCCFVTAKKISDDCLVGYTLLGAGRL